MLLRQVPPRSLQVDFQGVGDALVYVFPPTAHALHAADNRDGAVEERDRRIGDQQFGVKSIARAQAIAIGTHSLRAVEAEELRRWRFVTDIAVRAGIVSREKNVFRFGVRLLRLFARLVTRRFFDGHNERAVRERQGLLDCLGEPRAHAGFVLQAIDGNCDVVLDAFIQSQIIRQANDLPVHASAARNRV